MPKKKKEKNTASPYNPDEKVYVRKSYYTFSKEYPSKYLHFSKNKKKKGKKTYVKGILCALLFVCIVCASFFVMDLGLDISYTDKEKLSEETSVSDGETSSLAETGEIRALYMPYTELGNISYIKELIDEIKVKNANSVVIDFKTKDGKLAYSSLLDYAIEGKCALFDNNTVRIALDYFENSNITVIAGIYCFEDDTVSSSSPSLAVKYMDTDVNWLDGSAEDGGRSWLNPVSSRARNYIRDIIKELLQFKIKGFMLYSVSFPEGENTASATYTGEKDTANRNKVLKKFVKNIADDLPDGCFLLLSQSAEDALSGNENIYFGSMSDVNCDGIVADTSQRDEMYIVDKNTKFASMLSLFSSISNNYKDKLFIPQIDVSEYSRSYFYNMRKSGFNSFILYSSTGEY